MIKNINKRLSTKLAFWTIVIIIFLQLSNSWILIDSKKKELVEEITQNAQSYAKLTTDKVMESYKRYYSSGYFKFYQQMDDILALNKEIKDIYIIKTDGTIVFHPKELKERQTLIIKEKITDEEILQRIHSVEISLKIFIDNGKEYIDIVNPYFEDWGKHPYSIRFIFSFDTLEKQILRMKIKIFLISIISVILGIILVMYLSRTITKPLEMLYDGVKEISEGDLQHDIKVNSKDEIGVLSMEFNKMRKNLSDNFNQLEETQHSLENLNQTLEKKVLERTKTIENKNKELERLAITDRLTSLYNRKKLDETMENEINRAKRFTQIFGVILLDIDHFKSVNDTYGHQVGDQVLIEISNLLQNNTRVTDIVGRWGGEEFLIICPETKIEDIMQVAENIRKKIESHQFSVVKSKTSSFGVTVYNSGDDENSIVSRADDALYKAKKNGRNRVEIL